jgi:hypothetical protein
MVESVADLVGLLQAANAEKRAALYQSLRLSLIYDPS